ncbi:MAG: GNAT family N-acetyltransferase [Mucilaginibacter sp.]
MLSIRNVTLADIPLVRELTFKIWPQTYIPIIGEEQVAYMLDMMYSPVVLQRQVENKEQVFLLCHENEDAVAYAAYSDIGEGIYKLNKIYILPEKHGRGIGRFIINHLSTELSKRKAIALDLNVNRNNIPALLFYERLGFAKIADEDIDIGNGYFMNDHILRLYLV